MRKIPFLTLPQTLLVLRIITALIFVAHAAVRIMNGTIERFGYFLEDKGFPFGTLLVWLLTIYELTAGLLLTLGVFTRWLTCGFFLIVLIGLIIIHAANGWFVGEHGTGGMEYSVVLLAALLVIMAADKK